MKPHNLNAVKYLQLDYLWNDQYCSTTIYADFSTNDAQWLA